MSSATEIDTLRKFLERKIIGQRDLIDRMLIALLADGHLLIEGAPGLAKTKAIKELSRCMEATFQRIQFTPDLLPADITGSDIYRSEKGIFEFQKGPIFHNLVLADEINRAPAKVQSALLEAMAERQVTVGNKTYDLPDVFMVMATQNPIEQEGTYPLPEAQLDRFLMKVNVGYPEIDAELKILELVRGEASGNEEAPPLEISQSSILAMRKECANIHIAKNVESYLIALIMATRFPENYGKDLEKWISFGASPRATIALDRCAKVYAWLNKRDFVKPSDIKAIIHNILRHRLVLSYEAEADGLSTDDIIDMIIDVVPVS